MSGGEILTQDKSLSTKVQRKDKPLGSESHHSDQILYIVLF